MCLCGQNDFSMEKEQNNLIYLCMRVRSPHSHERKTKAIIYGNQNKDTSRDAACWVMVMFKTRVMLQNPGQPPTERRAMRRQILCLLINTPSEHTLFAPAASVITEKSITIASCTYYIFPIASLEKYSIHTCNDLLQLY